MVSPTLSFALEVDVLGIRVPEKDALNGVSDDNFGHSDALFVPVARLERCRKSVPNGLGGARGHIGMLVLKPTRE